jgi:hypothetical protein
MHAMPNDEKKEVFKVPRSALFNDALHHAHIKRHGVAFKYAGARLPGLTGKTKGLLRPRYFPYFDLRKARDAGLKDPGIPLKWKAPGPPPRQQSQRLVSMERRVGQGRARGNNLNKQVAIMVFMMWTFGVPHHHFTAAYRQTRVPKVLTVTHVQRMYPKFVDHDPEAKCLLSVLNSTRPHLGLLAQKAIELEIDVDAVEWPVAHEGVGLTAIDLTGIHRPTRARVNIEVKTGGDGYILKVHGNLQAPYDSLPNCVLNHYFLQTAHAQDWAVRSYPAVAPSFSIPLLWRITSCNAYHYPLPRVFHSPPSLG